MTQITDTDITNRFGYHRATSETGPLHHEFRETVIEFAKFLNAILPDGRAKATAFTRLEDCSMWANKAISEQAPVVKE